ncbi:uncharacterized protein LOC116209657 [Punica granatum]|uniref:Uncharacterized protein n=2 Tax=Punica granatum TaxID=22663 RepID=A0A2I0IIA6_PUNGR|nr:uncharacterized protein LOC116209657 [Punica granatum]PKI43046.1 hypothetical protein CRG98_036525 [Punica granatum]
MQSLSLAYRFPHLLAPSPSPISGFNRRFLSVSTRIGLKPCRLVTLCAPNPAESYRTGPSSAGSDSSKLRFEDRQSEWSFQVQSPSVVPPRTVAKLSLSDQAFFLLAFIACTTLVAFTSLVVAAVPTLYALRRAANSLSKLADTAREELPSTMAAVRLSGMEISDLTMELSDLSQEIADGVTKSAQAVQAAEAGIRQIGNLARQQTISMIQERASLPIISIQPVVVGAAKKTSRAVGQATKSLMNMISGAELNSENENDDESGIDLVEF